jgi:hypothetical protein
MDGSVALDFAAPAAIGAPRSDLVFTPVEPCRIFDSRLDALGPIQAGWARNYYVAGVSGFEEQGGAAGGCNIPLGDAAAVVINFVAVFPSEDGHLTAFAWEDPDPPLPLASVLNYGDGLYAIANSLPVPICDNLTQDCLNGFDLIVFTNRTVHVVGDVYGYFAPPTP